MRESQISILVIGGGAAGMMAALFAARGGAHVTLLERNEKFGKKIYITGKGRCNVTNDAEPEAFMKNIVRNPRFMYASLAALNNMGLMDLLESLGVKLKVERGGRVFPESDHASDITRALDRALSANGVRSCFNSRVASIFVKDGRAAGAMLEDGTLYPADRVILATGGLSYPATGSTGDGHRIAAELEHAVVPPLPALAPIETEESWPADLMGISLKNVKLSAYKADKRFYSEMGELLFTHFGVSGPLALTLSSLLPENPAGVRLSIDLKPALDDHTLEQRLLRDFKELQRKQLIRAVDGLAPHNLALKLIELANLSPAMPIHAVTQAQRRELRLLIKNLPLTVRGVRGFDEAIITRGGVSVKEINASTMESRRIPGLYFAGEIVDVDALTGGFNLQIAFSMGALAGKSASSRPMPEL